MVMCNVLKINYLIELKVILVESFLQNTYFPRIGLNNTFSKYVSSYNIRQHTSLFTYSPLNKISSLPLPSWLVSSDSGASRAVPCPGVISSSRAD